MKGWTGALAVVLLLGAMYLLGRLSREPVPAPVGAEAEPPRYTLSKARWVRLSAQGQPEFQVSAATIEYFRDESLRLSDLHMDTLGGASGGWVLAAPQGRAPPRERRILLSGGVTAQGQPETAAAPLSFQTRQLWVDQLRRELRTESEVTIEGPGRQARAQGFAADFEGERLQLLNDVRATYDAKSS